MAYYAIIYSSGVSIKMHYNTTDITDEKFGRWSVIKYSHSNSNRETFWICRCECGTIKTVGRGSLTKGSQSCGCFQRDQGAKLLRDLTGHKYGKLTVESHHHTIFGSPNRHYWLCRCDCGKTAIVRGDVLKAKTKGVKLCGCLSATLDGLSRDRAKYKKYYLSNPANKIRANVSRQVIHALKRQSGSKHGESVMKYLPYTVRQLKEHLEKQFEPWMSWSNYGGQSNDSAKTWWIDHIKPQVDFPYTSLDDPLFQECWALDNLRPLEKIANIQKGSS